MKLSDRVKLDEVSYPDEVWKPVLNYPNYLVSNFGRVASRWKSDYRCRSACDRGTVRLLKYAYLGRWAKKYPAVTLSHERQRKTLFVHVLVLEAFVSPRPAGLLGLHRDDNPDNTRLDNLYWGTERDNWGDRERNGLVARGSRNGKSKLTEDQVLEIKRLIQVASPRQSIARQFGVSPGCIDSIKRGDTWSYLTV